MKRLFALFFVATFVFTLATAEPLYRSTKATGEGFESIIEAVVIRDGDGRIVHLTVGENEEFDETEGIGSKVKEQKFVNQFIGETGPFEIGKNVDAVTGATWSSKGVVFAVNAALESTEVKYVPLPTPASLPIATPESTTMPEFTIRNSIKFGMSRSEIMGKETEIPFINENDMLVYSNLSISGISDTVLLYSFNKEDLLSSVAYMFMNSHSNENLFIDDYDKIEESLKEKYGNPLLSGPTWSNDLFKGDASNYGLAVSLGDLSYRSIWFLADLKISHSLTGDNYKIQHAILYLSNEYNDRENNDNKDL